MLQAPLTLSGWQMQDAAKVNAAGATVSSRAFSAAGWYAATVPGTVLTTLVDNKVYPEPLYGENMRAIPESLNKTSWWYRTEFSVPASNKGKLIWLHFAGINYSAEIYVNGAQVGSMRGAFIRGDFDITSAVKPGSKATLAVLIHPQPHPGIPHEHTVALGIGKNGGDTAIDGPTFLSTIGWDWLPAIRDRDTGIWLPVTITATGPAIIKDTFITSDIADSHKTADLKIATAIENASAKPVSGNLVGTIEGQGAPISFSTPVTLSPNSTVPITLDSTSMPQLHIENPKLWWPNGYGDPHLSKLTLRFVVGKAVSQEQSQNFGIRKVEYQVADSENLTLSVNGVRIFARGGNWGLDEGMKRIPQERIDAQFRMHALANLNIIRNWVGQSTSPDFYDAADKYGILLWDEFFQPNPGDGPNVTDIPTYLANVTDKVVRYRNHPSIVVWCARNEGYPPKELDDTLKGLMVKLDPTRLYQSNSADGRGVSSHGPYYWRSPRFFYYITEAFKTETGSVSVPTIESIQGMMPQKDWETINDDWAQHDMARGAQRGDEYPFMLAKRYGHIRNLADFVRKAQLANYEAFRAMYEGRNADMFHSTTGILTWMSHPAQPSFVWQLYHYDLDPNASLYAAKKAAESIHVQLNESTNAIQIVNNLPETLNNASVTATIYDLESKVSGTKTYPVASVAPSTVAKVEQLNVNPHITAVYFVKLDLTDSNGKLLSTNFYWHNVAQDDFTSLVTLPKTRLNVTATRAAVANDETSIHVTITNTTQTIALMTHLQLHDAATGKRVLPAFYSDNYLSLVPGESRTITVTAAAKNLTGKPLLMFDGYNITVDDSTNGDVGIALNQNAQPEHWPATNIVPDQQ
ncbi:MAG: glycoside hydrolase family 2 TIM barrel-domain containing protein [Edaphobacter sp.]|uniref:glycoside hydrolase family 2 protein n=1 Tax=Edaphobacter sp. TaxID=1934404 RepID=UPI0023A685F6|nr:sugar-binding domain-containing protein [Edaphobacter sp.]MDE1177553.1 glycoside hydrolase family 2 TIM barrel-domain containing protein [Edaphobacter sp.]